MTTFCPLFDNIGLLLFQHLVTLPAMKDATIGTVTDLGRQQVWQVTYYSNDFKRKSRIFMLQFLPMHKYLVFGSNECSLIRERGECSQVNSREFYCLGYAYLQRKVHLHRAHFLQQTVAFQYDLPQWKTQLILTKEVFSVACPYL